MPATFSTFSSRHLGTRYGSDGSTLARIDHIGLSTSTQARTESAVVWEDFSMPHNNLDHLPAALRIFPPVRNANGHFMRRKAKYDRKATADPIKQAEFQRLIDENPLPRFQVEPSSHAHILDVVVQNAAIQAFGPPLKRAPRQSYMTNEPMEIIHARGKALSASHFAGRMIKWSTAKVAFRAWAFQ